ncbi:unnamed protein product [Lampetra planeri]
MGSRTAPINRSACSGARGTELAVVAIAPICWVPSGRSCLVLPPMVVEEEDPEGAVVVVVNCTVLMDQSGPRTMPGFGLQWTEAECHHGRHCAGEGCADPRWHRRSAHDTTPLGTAEASSAGRLPPVVAL